MADLTVRKATVSFSGSGCSRERSELITRSLFQHVQAAMELHDSPGARRRVLNRLTIPPFEASMATMDNESIARDGAAWVFRHLREAEGS